MNVGITASRNGPTDYQMCLIEGLLLYDNVEVFRHGSCKGGDVAVARLIRKLFPKCYIIAHPGPKDNPFYESSGVDDEILPNKEFLERNRDIVNNIDKLYALPEGPETLRSGTWSTVRYAKKINKQVCIISPDGGIGQIDKRINL